MGKFKPIAGLGRLVVTGTTKGAPKAALTKSMLESWKRMPGWGKVAILGGPVAGGALLGAAGDSLVPPLNLDMDAMLGGLDLAGRRHDLYEPQAFSPHERAMFERHGLDPERLRFYKTLGQFMAGSKLESQLMRQAIEGELPEAQESATEPLRPYA